MSSDHQNPPPPLPPISPAELARRNALLAEAHRQDPEFFQTLSSQLATRKPGRCQPKAK